MHGSETIERIYMKFGIRSVWKFVWHINFGPYLSNITPNLYELESNHFCFPENCSCTDVWIMIQNIDLHKL
jgi:hypothetical protein